MYTAGSQAPARAGLVGIRLVEIIPRPGRWLRGNIVYRIGELNKTNNM